MLSFWEKKHFLKYDFIIVGGGIVGLSTAISLKEKSPDSSVLVLERGIFPTGASTKNAGFACFGSLSELNSDKKAMGKKQSLALVKDRWEGLVKLRERLGDNAIDFAQLGGYELIMQNEMYLLEKIEEINSWIGVYFNRNVFHEIKGAVEQFGFNSSLIKSVVFNPLEGQIDTGKMMKSLLHYAQKIEVNVMTGVEVQSIEDKGNEVSIVALSPLDNSMVEFNSQQAAICTNAFSKKFLHNEDISPGRGIILMTKPINRLKFKGVFHYDEGFFYFRNFGKRVIFGGGRNTDLESETTDEFLINEQIVNVLKSELNEKILPGQSFEIEHTWAGIMAFGKSKIPILKKVSDRVVAGVRLGGMGIAIGSRMGERLADMMTE